MIEHPLYCPVCGGQLLYVSEDTAYCIDADCGWRTPKCRCSSCTMDKCSIVSMCEMSIPPDDGNVFGKGLIVAYKNVIRWLGERKGDCNE